MKPIIFNDSIICYKTKYNPVYDKTTLINVIENNIITKLSDDKTDNGDSNINIGNIKLFINGIRQLSLEMKKDAYSIPDLYVTYFQDIIKFAAHKCEMLFQLKGKDYTHIHNNIWINKKL